MFEPSSVLGGSPRGHTSGVGNFLVGRAYRDLLSNDHRAAAVAIWASWASQTGEQGGRCARCGEEIGPDRPAHVTILGVAESAGCSRQVVRTTLRVLQLSGWCQVDTRSRCVTLRWRTGRPSAVPHEAFGETPPSGVR